MTTATLSPEAERRADLLISRYARLTEGNPGFHYHLHMQAWEQHVADRDSITAALIAGASRRSDLARLLDDDKTYQTWRLRLEHPAWWIGGRVRGTTPLLAQVISELAPAPEHEETTGPICHSADGEPVLSFSGCHSMIGGSGFVGAHWVNQTMTAIKPLSDTTNTKLVAALRRELLGRNLCQVPWLVDTDDTAAAFPESEIEAAIDVAAMTEAIDAVEAIHGPVWADAVTTMLGDVDPIVWPGITDALINENRTAARP